MPTTHLVPVEEYLSGDLVRRDLSSFEVRRRGPLPFDSGELLARLDEE